jgi:hypothetical protein
MDFFIGCVAEEVQEQRLVPPHKESRQAYDFAILSTSRGGRLGSMRILHQYHTLCRLGINRKVDVVDAPLGSIARKQQCGAHAPVGAEHRVGQLHGFSRVSISNVEKTYLPWNHHTFYM